MPEPRSCATCLLCVPMWKDAPSPGPLCSWFLKKFQVPKPIPAAVYEVGCTNWQGIPKEDHNG